MSNENTTLDSLSSALRALQLTHQRQLSQLLQRQQTEVQDLLTTNVPVAQPLPASVVATSTTSSPPTSPVSDSSLVARCRLGHPLFLGSSVRLVSSARSGKKGDSATVHKPTSADPTSFVSIRLDSSGTITTRKASNLALVE